MISCVGFRRLPDVLWSSGLDYVMATDNSDRSRSYVPITVRRSASADTLPYLWHENSAVGVGNVVGANLQLPHKKYPEVGPSVPANALLLPVWSVGCYPTTRSVDGTVRTCTLRLFLLSADGLIYL